MTETSSLSPHIDPLAPYATAFLRSVWRLYLNPSLFYEQFRQVVLIEFEAAGYEVGRRLEVLRSQMRKIVARQLRDKGDLDLANRLESAELRWDLLDRVKEKFSFDPGSFHVSAEGFEFFKEFAGDRTKSFSDLLALFEAGLDKAPSEQLLKGQTSPETFDYVKRAFSSALALFRVRTADLRPDLIGGVRDVSAEYLEWIRLHSNVLDQVAWEAFEKIIAEIFASRGFSIDFTARIRNKSADLLALRIDDVGVSHGYLIECKRFSRSRPVGVDIVNAVLGASRRAGADHAFLVTSSSFTQDVLSMRDTLRELRLHLRDGDNVSKWLSEYTPCDSGLWIAPNLEI